MGLYTYNMYNYLKYIERVCVFVHGNKDHTTRTH